MPQRKKSSQQVNARREARETVFKLLFESEYHTGETPEEILTRSLENWEQNAEDTYTRNTYLGIMQHLEEIDALIGGHARGWSTGRLSRVSRAVLRLGTYELAFSEDIPAPVAINEAVELAKTYDDVKARAFVNGVLNAVKNQLQGQDSPMPAATADEPSADHPAQMPAESHD